MFHTMLLGVVVIGLAYTILRLIIPAKFGRRGTVIISAVYAFVGMMYPAYQHLEPGNGGLMYLWGWLASLSIGAVSTLVFITLL